MVSSKDEEKIFDKIQYPFPQPRRLERNTLNLTKVPIT